MGLGGPTPVYLQVIQWAGMIVQLLYPIALVVILALALVKFWQLVNRIAPGQEKKAETGKVKVEEK